MLRTLYTVMIAHRITKAPRIAKLAGSQVDRPIIESNLGVPRSRFTSAEHRVKSTVCKMLRHCVHVFFSLAMMIARRRRSGSFRSFSAFLSEGRVSSTYSTMFGYETTVSAAWLASGCTPAASN